MRELWVLTFIFLLKNYTKKDINTGTVGHLRSVETTRTGTADWDPQYVERFIGRLCCHSEIGHRSL